MRLNLGSGGRPMENFVNLDKNKAAPVGNNLGHFR